ncbi:uncharacterized protein A4U43_C07F19890 [Asparagus officinalis]|uniref:Uncharacterized protein n=1 Tax=Asparagus officinalis TaxID=4686 RepID=A0A5P1EGR0_ASPOF|nr:uncharacterized protein A4U43_C07F19890 [Asparagus officinalis]
MDKNACRRGGDGDGRRRRWWLGSKARRSEFGYGADGGLGSESLVRWVREEMQTAAWADPPAAVLGRWGVGRRGLGWPEFSWGEERERDEEREENVSLAAGHKSPFTFLIPTSYGPSNIIWASYMKHCIIDPLS